MLVAPFQNKSNIGFTFGYTNASWTLKSDLTSEYLCRIINDLDKQKSHKAMPVNKDNNITQDTWLKFLMAITI
ncbi:hypothetical protein A9Q81_12770 [Gammaproteobacteria bacterium 42_54_T18]|nr:hypothetical protein A9Q81_12770 [Gammaproteobacteria bacterium 42_54_T18]